MGKNSEILAPGQAPIDKEAANVPPGVQLG